MSYSDLFKLKIKCSKCNIPYLWTSKFQQETIKDWKKVLQKEGWTFGVLELEAPKQQCLQVSVCPKCNGIQSKEKRFYQVAPSSALSALRAAFRTGDYTDHDGWMESVSGPDQDCYERFL